MMGTSITLQDYILEDVVRLMREIGYNGAEMWKPHLRRCVTDELRCKFVQYAKENGLTMGGFNVVAEPYYQPFGTDEESQSTLDNLKADLHFAISLGVRDVLIWEGVRPRGYTDQQCKERCLPRLLELFRAFLAYAAPLSGRLLVEPHPFTVGMNNQFLIKLYDTLDSPHFGITYDCCHYGVGQPKDYVAAIHALGPRIRHIHWADSDQMSSELHFALGAGCMDLDAILKAFKAIRYNGTMTLDLINNPTPIYSARLSMSRFRQACDFLGVPC